ncbi:MAG: NAD(+)/NADH kinase [Candidatus ainarchaeum sp.]|nr:NAD(+)/NADH kinase [Candidatus ainarchaeum sp.]
MIRLTGAVVRSNPRKPKSAATARQVAETLLERGVEVHARAAEADMLILVGGDGTILFDKQETSLPIFGIGGKHSKICQANEADWREKLAEIMEKGFLLDERATLSCRIGGREAERALNDVVVRSRDYHMVGLQLEIGGRAFRFRADGVVISTPTGSSAYSYACGGKILAPHARKLVVAGIAPHMRAFKPMVVPDSSKISVKTESGAAQVVVDGQFAHALAPGREVAVSRSRRGLALVRLPHQNPAV